MLLYVSSSDLSNNPLGCDCDVFYTMDWFNDTVLTGGTCATPTQTAGVLFGTSNSNAAKYFRNENIDIFTCCKFLLQTLTLHLKMIEIFTALVY